jgi:EmrB/QacA subfamily drug resistance transporter
LATAEFMVVLDASIVNIALPGIGAGLSLPAARLAWVITAYVVAFGALLPLGGRLGDLLGRRRLFRIGVGLFSAASLVCGLAPSATVLIIARAVQGLGAALLSPATLSLITSTFTASRERARAMGVWGAVAAGGAAAGVLLGGLLTGGLGWRSIFLINVPIGIAVLAALGRFVAESRADTPADGTSLWSRLDLPGAASVTAGLVALVGTLSEAHAWGWASPATIGGFAAAAVLLAGFLAVEARAAHPLVPLRLFRLPTVRTGNTVMLLTGAAMLAVFYFLSLDEQLVLGYGPIAAGLSQLPMALALIAAAGLAGSAMARLGPRAVLASGLVIFAAGLAWFATSPATASFTVAVLGPSLLVGLGLGAAFVPVTTLAVTGVPADDTGVASGLVNTAQQVGGAIGLAALAALAEARTTSLPGTTHIQALTTGYHGAFAAAAGIALAAAAITTGTVGHRRAARQPGTTEHPHHTMKGGGHRA